MTREDLLLNAVCDELTLNVTAVLGKCRKRELVEARQMICFVLRKYTRMSLLSIAHLIGYEEHATVLYSINNVKSLLETNSKFREKMNPVLKRIDYLSQLFDQEDQQQRIVTTFFDFYSEAAFEQTAVGFSETKMEAA